jgi:hypothetical protein
VAEFNVGGQRVDIDTSDNPSSAEIQKRIEAELARLTTESAPAETQQPAQPVQEAVQQPVQEEQGILDTVINNVAEIPEGIASGATKTIANISNLADRATGGAFSDVGDWMNENILDLGYIHIGKGGEISWTDDKIDTAEPDAEDNAVEIFNTETITGDITEGISQFVTGLVLTRRAGFNGNSALSLAGQSVVAENLAFDPYQDRLSNLVEEYPSLANPVTEFLAADENDSEAEARFKMSLEALGMEAAGVALFSAFRAYRNYSKGLEADPNDTAQIEAWIDSQAPDVDVSIKELDAKMNKAVEAEAKLRETYQRVDANSHILAPETVAKIKADARGDAVESTTDALKGTKDADGNPTPDLIKRGQELYGYGVTKSNKELVREADDVIAEVFVDSPSVISGLEALKATISPKDFDVYVTAAGRVLQMTSRNLAEVNQGLRTAEKELESAFKQLDARTDLSPEELVQMKGELQQNFLAHQDNFRQVRNDYIESVMAFRGASTTAGRSVQVNKLFQNFDVPPQQVEKHFDQLLRNLPSDKVRNSFVARAVFALNKKGGNILKALDEIFISGILTGFKTHVVNMVGNTATTVYLPVERAMAAGVRVLGGDVKGGAESFQKAMATFTGMRHSIVESSRLAVEAYKIGDTILDNKSTYENQSRTVVGRDLPFDKKTLGELWNWITLRESEVTLMDLLGTSMRALSTRALTTEDEFFKNINFRSYVYGNAYVDALNAAKRQGLSGAEAREQAKITAGKAVQAASNEQMMLGKYNMPDDLGLEAYRKDALQYGREATYTQGLSKGGASFQGFVENVPMMRQVFPFVRTPLNLISASIQRSPLAPLSGRWRDDFMAGGERKALAMTRLALGTAIVSNIMMDFTEKEARFEATGEREGVEFTGAGPTQVGARQNQQELSGKIFGSVVTADGNQYQISRFDPFSTIFEGIGVIQDLHRNGQTEEADNLTLAYGLAIARMLGNDTYATSVRQIMYAMENENGLDKFLQGRASQLVPLSGLTKNFNQVNDPFQRELRSYTDALKSSIPGMSGSIAPRYNLLGEPVEAPKYATLGILPESMEAMISPIMTGKVKTDPVAVEIVNQNISTMKQSPYIKGGVINLNDERLSVNALGEPLYGDNRTAYDRFNDIMANERLFGKRTLREQLEYIITSSSYQDKRTDSIRIDTPLGKKASISYAGTRKDILTATISEAKQYALLRLRKENPMVNEAILLADKAPKMAGSRSQQEKLVEDNQQFINQLNAPLEGK